MCVGIAVILFWVPRLIIFALVYVGVNVLLHCQHTEDTGYDQRVQSTAVCVPGAA
eukprot:m.1642074 g.1642074  ORF g.1642074 m.1642074 type:complete len:55 (-) comp51440_c0_seq1:67-231(-)